MPRRFSQLLNAHRNSTAYTRFAAWRDASADRPRNPGSGEPRGRTVELGILPFGFDVPTGTVIRGSCTESARGFMSTAVGTHANAALGTLTVSRLPGFKAARVILFNGTGGTSTPTSEITGLSYLRYNGKSYSHPFGKATGTDLEYETFTDIRTALLTGSRRVSYQPEKRQVIA